MVVESTAGRRGGVGGLWRIRIVPGRRDRRHPGRPAAWLDEHAEFLAEPPNAALVRALIAAAAARPADGEDLYQQLSAPQLVGLTTRLRHAVEGGELRADADIDAVANALVGTMLFHALTHPGSGAGARFDGLVDALLNGILNY